MFEDSELDVPFYFGRERERGLVEANLMASQADRPVRRDRRREELPAPRGRRAPSARPGRGTSLEDRGDPELAVVIFDSLARRSGGALRRACIDEITRALGGVEAACRRRPAARRDASRWQQLLGGDLYVLLDQVEEYFLHHQDEDGPGTFAAELAAVVASADLPGQLPARDPRGRAREARRVQAADPERPRQLPAPRAPRPAAGRAAILGPVDRYNGSSAPDESGVELEPELVDAVLDQVATGQGRRRAREGARCAGEDARATGSRRRTSSS